MKIVAFGASTSKKSINKTLAGYAASLLQGAQVELLDLNDYDIPLFSEDREVELGKPKPALDFLAKIASADALVISFAEHNGSYTAAYKNLFDWASRIDRNVYQNKPVIHLSASPGPRGAANTLNAANQSAPFFGADLKGSLSIPSFYENFDINRQELTNTELKQQLIQTMETLLATA